jgi:hypothetical protein
VVCTSELSGATRKQARIVRYGVFMELLIVGLVAVLTAKCMVRLEAQEQPASPGRLTRLRLILPSELRVSAFGFPGWVVRDVDAMGSARARLRRRVCCFWTEQEWFYGTRVVPGYLQCGAGGKQVRAAASAIANA